MSNQTRKKLLSNFAFLLATVILFTVALGVWLFIVGRESEQTAAAHTQLAQATLPAPLIVTATSTPRPPTITPAPSSTPSATPTSTATSSPTPSLTPTPQTFVYPDEITTELSAVNTILAAVLALDAERTRSLLKSFALVPCHPPDEPIEGPSGVRINCRDDQESGDLTLTFNVSYCHGLPGYGEALIEDLLYNENNPLQSLYAIYTVTPQNPNFDFRGQPDYVLIFTTGGNQFAKEVYVKDQFISSYHLGCGQTAAGLAQQHTAQGGTPILPPLTQPYDPTN